MATSRLYVNSYLMTDKNTGSYDDCEFEVNLGDRYSNVVELSLDSAILDNQWTNFYESATKDFRNLGVIIGGVTYSLKIDRFLTWTQLISWVNTTQLYIDGYSMENVGLAIDDGKRIYQCRFRRRIDNVIMNSTLVGDAWDKIGFVLDGVSRQLQTGYKSYDFTQSSVVLIQMEMIGQAFRSAYGTFQFLVPNTSVYGSKLYYQNTQSQTCQKVVFNTPVTFDRLRIKLLNCDLKKLETSNSGAGKNKNDVENLFVLSVRHAD